MTFTPVPWFVAGGHHGPEIARLLAYAATGGVSGIIAAGDLAVSPTAVPGTSVRIGAGACSIVNNAAGAGGQSYVARNPSDAIVPLTATGSSGPRSDLIVARVRDPQYPGTAPLADPANGPYVFAEVITGVPSTTNDVHQVAGHENDSAITLARIDRPASTGTVNAGNIVDLRPLAQPKAQHELRIANPAVDDIQDFTGTDGEVWPNEAQWQITIPEWATHARIMGTWAQISCPPGGVTGWLFVRLGSGSVSPADTERTRYDMPSSGGLFRGTFVCADEIGVPHAIRGATVTLNMRAYTDSGEPLERITADSGSAIVCMVDFIEKPGF